MSVQPSLPWEKRLVSVEEAEEQLKKATFNVRLGRQTDPQSGKRYYEWGTGFFFTTDLALTADHNLRPYSRKKYFEAYYQGEWIRLEWVKGWSSQRADIAVLRCVKNAAQVPIAPLAVAYLDPALELRVRKQFWAGREVCIYGYPFRGTSLVGWRIEGAIDFSLPLVEAREVDRDGYGRNIEREVQRLNMRGSRIDALEGISGAAIFEREQRVVIGVQGSYEPERHEVRGTEIAQLIDEHPELKRYVQPLPPPQASNPPSTPVPSIWQRWQEGLAATLFARRNTKRYLRNLMAQHREFTFLGRAKPLELERIYVSLKVGDYAPRPLRPDKPDPSSADESPAPVGMGRSLEVPEALAHSPRLVVLGDPGAGKTTLLKYLALQLGQRTPSLADFARGLIPTPLTRRLDTLCRSLSGATTFMPALLSGLVALLFWLVQALRSSLPGTALAVWALFFIVLIFLLAKVSRRATAISACLALGLLYYAGWYQPQLVGPWAVGLMGLSVGILLFPVWVQPPLACLRALLQYCTRYPLPVYLTLNHVAGNTQSIEHHLAEAMAEAGFPHPYRFLRRKLERGECLLLLDALDEVVDTRAHQHVVTEVNRLRAAYGGGNRIIVTSRIAGFQRALDGYQQLEVEEFSQVQIELFIRSWFADTADPDERARRVDGLLRGLGRSPRMRLLASNPLLLSLMTLLYEQNWQLPERRVELYEECVNLLTAEWDRLRGVTRASQFSFEQKQQVLTQVAAQFHAVGVRVFEHEQLLAALAAVFPTCGCAHADPSAFLEEIMVHTGLLRQKSRSSYDFVHLTFQEFFTAQAFHDQADGEMLLGHTSEAWWREVIRLYAGLERDATALLERLRSQDLFLAAGCLADCRPLHTPEFRHAADAIVSDLQHLMRDDAAQQQDAADALAEIAGWDATQFLVEAAGQDESKPALALAAVLALTRAADKAVLDTLFADIGRTLRLLHRQLPGVAPGLRTRLLALLERLGHPLVFVPAGPFRMGGDSYVDERPPHTVTLPAYWLDMFPVTSEQFAQFVQATDYQAQGGWRSAFTPGKERHPVVKVSWEDARAYAEWCGKRLPTEAEWEKAARGTDDREYPWGNQWDGNKCNVSGRDTTPVGSYPAGASPYGCQDMAGNVQEWCQDWYDANYYPHSPDQDPKGPDSGETRSVRGGSWLSLQWNARVAYRNWVTPGFVIDNLGFRCASS